MTKPEITDKICTHLNISAPSLSNAKKQDLEALASALGLVLTTARPAAHKSSTSMDPHPVGGVGPDGEPDW